MNIILGEQVITSTVISVFFNDNEKSTKQTFCAVVEVYIDLILCNWVTFHLNRDRKRI